MEAGQIYDGRSDVYLVEILDGNIEGMKLLNSLSRGILRLDNSKYLH